MNAFDAPNFKASEYVRELVQECVGGPELQQRKAVIQSYSDQTSSFLKKHVYDNYMQFIETAKEISHLEAEMYQLSHILTEQRNILSEVREENSNNDDIDNNDDEEDVIHTENQKVIREIKDLLHGYTGNLDDKKFIHEGALIELDPDNYRPICRFHLFLFNDLLVMAKVKHDKSLEYSSQYDATKIAVINIKDLDGVKNALNLITSDGSRILQCVNLNSKVIENEWIDRFEFARKSGQMPKLIVPKVKAQAPKPPSAETRSIASDVTETPSTDTISINWPPDWLAVAAEEINALIAQRHFEDALLLIQKCEDYFKKDCTFYQAAEIIEKIKQLKLSLATVLLKELSNAQSNSLQSALRSSRRSLVLLVDMGKAREACGTVLRICTNAIRAAQRQARRNNLAVSDLFFCDLAQVTSEFLKAFNKQTACVSTLVVWANMELQYFASQMVKHYLTKGTSLEIVAKCVECMRTPCAQLTELGLDLSYHLEGLLRSSLEQLVDESRMRLIESLSRTEDNWQPHNLQTRSNLKNFLKDFNIIGIDLSSEVTGDTWINLSVSTLNFCRHYITVVESCAYLAKTDTILLNVEVLLRDLFKCQYSMKPNPHLVVDLNFVSRNRIYITEVLLPIAMTRFEAISGRKSEMMNELLRYLREPPKPKPRSVYQTDVL